MVSGAALREAPAGDAPEVAAAAEDAVADGSGQRIGVAADMANPSVQTNAVVGKPSRRDDKSHARMLRRLAREIRLIRGIDDRFYAEIPIDGRHAVHALESRSFKFWLIRRYRQRRMAVPNRDRLNTLIAAFEADAAVLESPEPVWIRVADGTSRGRAGTQAKPEDHSLDLVPAGTDLEAVYYLDLGDSTWQSVEIRADGCRIVDHPPVLFRRPHGFRPLPRPEWDGSIDLLKKYTNIADADFPLLVAWMTAALRPVGPYPILILTGEQGSAKSTMARVARRLIDPCSAPLKAPPSGQRDFSIQANNTWVMAYDNVSSISHTLSDGFCRTATGGAFSTRSLYSNDGETLFDIKRPAIVTGIDEFLHRSDLIDRCVILHLPSISDEARRREQPFWSEFDADYSRILGALLTAIASGLKMLPRVDLPALPRMADFAQWGEAVIRGLGWRPGSFLHRYNANRRAACDSALDQCEVAQALRDMMELAEGPWRGTATELLQVLPRYARRRATNTAQWPKTPWFLSRDLRRIIPQLRTIGITVTFERVDNTRNVVISQGEGHGATGALVDGGSRW